jgi:outer membrane protein TolC
MQPLFQGGRLDGLRDEAAIRWQQSENDYRQTVLVAFKEVETLLSSEKWLFEQEQARLKTADELREAEQLASEDYVSGLTDINTLLQTQRQAFDAESSLLTVRKSRLENRVNLFLALGGPIAADTLELQTEK